MSSKAKINYDLVDKNINSKNEEKQQKLIDDIKAPPSMQKDFCSIIKMSKESERIQKDEKELLMKSSENF